MLMQLIIKPSKNPEFLNDETSIPTVPVNNVIFVL